MVLVESNSIHRSSLKNRLRTVYFSQFFLLNKRFSEKFNGFEKLRAYKAIFFCVIILRRLIRP